MAARCIVFQDHSTGSGDVGIFGDCSFVITDGNCDILSLVDRQVFAALPSVLSMVTSPLLVIFALPVTALLSAERITSLES